MYFEYIYFARLDSKIDNISVYEARIRGGATLAKTYPVDADLVCGVPDSGLASAKGYSEESGIPFGLAFHKTAMSAVPLSNRHKRNGNPA